jgi:hypothetical protein
MAEATDIIGESKDSLAQPNGPTYAEGDGRVMYVGWLPDGPYGCAGFRAVIEFPSGPPNMPASVVWRGTPVRIEIVEDTNKPPTLTTAEEPGSEGVKEKE